MELNGLKSDGFTMDREGGGELRGISNGSRTVCAERTCVRQILGDYSAPACASESGLSRGLSRGNAFYNGWRLDWTDHVEICPRPRDIKPLNYEPFARAFKRGAQF